MMAKTEGINLKERLAGMEEVRKELQVQVEELTR